MELRLLCEGLTEPIGIDTSTPQLSWSKGPDGIRQRACQVQITSHGKIISDSGWMETADSRYTVPVSLHEKTDYQWMVTVKTDTGEETESETAAFRTGIFSREHLKGSFITGDTLLRKEFTLKHKPAYAALSFTGLGYCEAWINGEKVGNDVLFPSYTTYEKTVEYTVKDVTSLLNEGPNAVGLMLAGHWELDDNLCATSVYSEAFYRGVCMGLCQLEIDMEDGTQVIIGSDDSWQVSRSPVTFSSVFDGEHYDARLEQPGWCNPGFDASGWENARICQDPSGVLRYSYIPPIQVIEDIPVCRQWEKNGEQILDFGQNFSGWIRLTIQEAGGTRLRIRYAEVLYDDGTLNTENLRNAKATDFYTCKGGGESYEPRFTYHGFRYVSIAGMSSLSAKDVTGRVVHTSNPLTGSFHCSNEDFNRIYRAMTWTMRSNMHSIPTDCCQRDERQGWMADAGVSSEFGVLNFDLQRFYRKWFQDIRDTQLPDGSFPLAGAPGWPRDTFIWKIGYYMSLRNLYLYTGDIRTVRDNYISLQKYEAYMHSTLENGLIPYDFYNDWLAIEFANNLMVSNSYFADFYNAMILFADALEDEAGLTLYTARRQALVDKINEVFYGWCLDNPRGTGYYGTCDTLAAAPLAMALEYGIVPEELQNKVEDALLWQLTRSRGSVQFPTGILTSGILVDCLAHREHDDIAYQLLNREDYPSLRFMLSHGATTIWERWQYLVGNEMNSHNHPALCSLGPWFFKSLCGLRKITPKKDGTAQVLLRPYLPEEMNHAQMSIETHWGTIRLEWNKNNNRVSYKVTLPGRVSGKVIMPDGNEKDVSAGDFTFSW
ncbi:MAG: family 78 glycoside hydrolase catalytic domain [Lachnospiraceae bacterium]|jgi:alpha-L-rhamnosidase|nr:family 78 glycoside hydrolase catalytic domain [Lachnospiraceae bacterium]